MEKEKLINEIDQTIESIKYHISRVKNNNFKVHKLDVDLLIEKSRKLYDTLISLDALSVSLDIETPEEVKQEPGEVKEEASHEIIKENSEDEPSMTEEINENKEMPAEPEVSSESVEPDIDRTEDNFVKETEQPENKEVTKEEEKIKSKSTIDLFSTSVEPTLGEKLKAVDQTTIADKITKEAINELREAIGINEKFLFINELFNGDMNRYNKIIDELDQFPTLEGVNTYMLEIKIQNQWTDDNPALIKLTELLQRKFVKY
jgi:hypothetical protein